MRRISRNALACSALALAIAASPALAQQGQRRPLNIFEALFPGIMQERLQRERLANPAPAAKIESPKYYNFAAEKLVRVALKARTDVAVPHAAPGLQEDVAAGARGQIAQAAIDNSSVSDAGTPVIETAAVSAGGAAEAGTRDAEAIAGVDPAFKAAALQEAALTDAATSDNGSAASGEAVAAVGIAGQAEGQAAADGALAPQSAPQIDPAIVALAAAGPLFDRIAVAAEPAIAAEIARYYAVAERTLWLDAGLEPNDRARAAIAVLQTAEEYGLVSSEYAVAEPISGLSGEAAAAEAARFEIELTARAMRYAMDAAAGRVNPNKLSGYHDFPEGRIAAAAVLEKLAAGDPAAALTAIHPQNEQFAALKSELAELSRQTDNAIVIAPDTLIKPGETHGELANVIAAIRKKASEKLAADFAVLFDPAAPAPVAYTPELVDLVKAFQKEAGLKADGVIGRGTVSRLAEIGVAQKREQVLVALEQLRWLPHKLGDTHVFVNQPSFRARFVEGGRSRLEMRVVVGTPANQTSFFHDVIETVEYNPYWGIPQSILVNEYLPKLRANPYYLDERGYIVTDGKGRRIPSGAIDWWAIGNKVPFDVKQEPGEANALGELKILFPNKHNIYMHDTPQKALFGNDQRAYSHGCIRLQKPREMAAAVLGTSVAHIEQKLAQGHNQEEVKRRIPVYVAYFTAWPNDDGKVEYFGDIYGRDANLRKAVAATSAARAAG